MPPDRNSWTFYFITFSRNVRVINTAIFLSKYHKLGHTDVDRQIIIVLMTMILLFYVASGMYEIAEKDLVEI